jgi:excisionase family DNA binding protein
MKLSPDPREANSTTSQEPATSSGTSAVPGLLKPAEAATFLAISRRLLWSLTNQGLVRVVRIGRLVRYDRDDLLAWVQSRKSNEISAVRR